MNNMGGKDMGLIDKFPQIKIPNKFFRNDGEMAFTDLENAIANNDGTYSKMCGFIGGCSAVFGNTVIFFGDIDNFKCKEKLTNYIYSKGFEIKDFKNMDVIDYGSCIFLD